MCALGMTWPILLPPCMTHSEVADWYTSQQKCDALFLSPTFMGNTEQSQQYLSALYINYT